ncbi:hypothetical protein VTN00DRAFT_1200 [Thermoascus crustaceus]|uniref:uncharacterized protein n=1 Tax=Thermoascus crustaceus TaxID=5088 RepID=UPI0037421BAE
MRNISNDGRSLCYPAIPTPTPLLQGHRARHDDLRPQQRVNLDFDARVPIPFSVFPSSYRSDAVSSSPHQTRVEEEVNFDRTARVGREDTLISSASSGVAVPAPVALPDPRIYGQEEVDLRVVESRRPSSSRHYQDTVSLYEEPVQVRYSEVESTLSSDRESTSRYDDHRYVYDQPLENQLDITERENRRRIQPTYEVDVSSRASYQSPSESYSEDSFTREVDVQASQPYYTASVEVDTRKTQLLEEHPTNKMGYYDDEGNYHSFRRGVERAADRILHPLHHHDKEIVLASESGPTRVSGGVRENVRVVQPRGGNPPDTVPIPCHFIRIGDLLILQGRPCQVIRISVSSQTGQHRYVGVDLFTRQLHEESSFVSHPSPSVVVQTMLGPVYKTYRVLDIRDDGHVVAMTESGDVKQGLPVVNQGNLFQRISDAFNEGRGSVRALVINDGGRELVVDYKVIHGARL